jgi:hypothetical protein
MTRTAAESRADEIARRFGRDAVMLHSYDGSQLAPLAVEAIASWDVSSHAQREQARLGMAAPAGRRASY